MEQKLLKVLKVTSNPITLFIITDEVAHTQLFGKLNKINPIVSGNIIANDFITTDSIKVSNLVTAINNITGLEAINISGELLNKTIYLNIV